MFVAYSFGGLVASFPNRAIARLESGRSRQSTAKSGQLFGHAATEKRFHCGPRSRKRHDLPCNYGTRFGRPPTYGPNARRCRHEERTPIHFGSESARQGGLFWRKRWLSKRIVNPDVLQSVEQHTLVYPVTHGARVVLPPLGERGLFNEADTL